MAPADVTFRDWCCFAAATEPVTAVEVFLLSGDAVENVVENFVETSTHLSGDIFLTATEPHPLLSHSARCRSAPSEHLFVMGHQ